MILSPLGWLNFLVLQWFGVRLARSRTTLIGSSYYQPGDRVCITRSGGAAERWRVAEIDESTMTLERYSILRWVWPLTGWWSDYQWIARRS